MEEILHQVIDSLPHYLQGFICVAGFQPLNYQYYQGKYLKKNM